MDPFSLESAPDVSSAKDCVFECLGIDALASDLGLPAMHLAIAAAEVVSTVAGPNLRLETPWGAKKFGGINLVLGGRCPAYNDLLDYLSDAIELIQRDHVINAEAYSTEMVDCAVSGTSRKTSRKKQPDSSKAAAEADLASVFERRDYSLGAELKGYERVMQREALLNPKILIGQAETKTSLKGKVARCHEHFALVMMAPSSKRGDKPANVRDILALDRGVDVPCGSDRGLDTPVAARFLIALDPSDREKAATLGIYRRFLFLRDDLLPPIPTTSGRDYVPFLNGFNQAIEKLWEQRRSGGPRVVRFDHAINVQYFWRQLRKFQHDCNVLGACGEAARELPEALFLLFRHFTKPECNPQQEHFLIDACFEISAAALLEHQDVVAELLFPDMNKEISALVSKILEALGQESGATAELGPKSFNKIIRNFSQPQRKKAEIINDIMIGLGVVIFHEDETYELGRIPVEEVWDELLRQVGARLIAEV